jgi:predicted RNase H-like nuclease (RuvC/YqgF family)
MKLRRELQARVESMRADTRTWLSAVSETNDARAAAVQRTLSEERAALAAQEAARRANIPLEVAQRQKQLDAIHMDMIYARLIDGKPIPQVLSEQVEEVRAAERARRVNAAQAAVERRTQRGERSTALRESLYSQLDNMGLTVPPMASFREAFNADADTQPLPPLPADPDDTPTQPTQPITPDDVPPRRRARKA